MTERMKDSEEVEVYLYMFGLHNTDSYLIQLRCLNLDSDAEAQQIVRIVWDKEETRPQIRGGRCGGHAFSAIIGEKREKRQACAED